MPGRPARMDSTVAPLTTIATVMTMIACSSVKPSWGRRPFFRLRVARSFMWASKSRSCWWVSAHRGIQPTLLWQQGCHDKNSKKSAGLNERGELRENESLPLVTWLGSRLHNGLPQKSDCSAITLCHFSGNGSPLGISSQWAWSSCLGGLPRKF